MQTDWNKLLIIRELRIKHKEETMKKLQLKYFMRIKLEEKNDVNPQSFRFIDSKTEKEITNDYL